MSINGMRSAATATPPAPPATPGDTAADTKGATPGPGMNGEHRSELSERPPQPGSETAIPPRIALTKLGSVLPEQAAGALPAEAQAFADKVRSDVDNGKLVLLASHSTASIKAAAGAAFTGWLALKNDLSLPR
jgi:hypothetical protein